MPAIAGMCGRSVVMCGTAGASLIESELGRDSSESMALVVRDELALRRLSRQWLADKARFSLSTLDKALAVSRPATLATVERALGSPRLLPSDPRMVRRWAV